MPAYMTHRERQAKHADLLTELAGPLRRFLPDSWVLAAGGVATRVAAFPPSGHGMVHTAPSASRYVREGSRAGYGVEPPWSCADKRVGTRRGGGAFRIYISAE